MEKLMEISRLNWACRRGMLELDFLLQPFVKQHYDALTLADKQTFQRLLACDDPQLFAWFMQAEPCPDSALAAMIDKIRLSAHPATETDSKACHARQATPCYGEAK